MKKIIVLIIFILTITSCTNIDKKISSNNTWSIKETNLENNNKNMTNIVEKGSNIAVIYTGSLEDGTVFDATSKHWWTPLEFTAGVGQMIPGFDAWVIWMKIWETKIIEIESKDAYWEYDENKKQVIPKKDLVSFTSAGIKLEKGEKLPTQSGEFEIIKVDEETITIDVNHPLAWKKLTFEVKIESIK